MKRVGLFFGLFLITTSVVSQNAEPPKYQPPATPPPPAPVLTPAQALKSFTLAPGFRIDLIAAEPLVSDPVAMTFGPDGRLWVVEMRGYMPNVEGTGEDAKVGRIVVLKDTNGDGRMDHSAVFLDHLVLPTTVMLVDDGVLVGEAPHLWFCKDKNGDGVADEKTEIAGDYGHPGNPEEVPNALMWGRDNWIYTSNQALRFRYLGHGKFERAVDKFSAYTSYSNNARGQWGLSQDDAGHLYHSANEDPLRMDVFPVEALRRNPNLPTPLQQGKSPRYLTLADVPRAANLEVGPEAVISVHVGHPTPGIDIVTQLAPDGTLPVMTAACGTVIYRGGLFPREFYGNPFVADPAGNLVKRLILEEREGVPRTRNAYPASEFLTSTDERFRPVSLYNGPDGALYVVDFYRGVIQHRIYLTPYLRKHIADRQLEQPIGLGRIYRIAPVSAPRAKFKSGLAGANVSALVNHLADPNGWVRDTAQRLLVERPRASSVPLLRQVVKSSSSALARLHALWTLEGLNALDWPTLERALKDPDTEVAAAAVRLSGAFLAKDSARVLPVLQVRAAWRELPVLQQLALVLHAAPPNVADPVLTQLTRQSGGEAFMADAIVSSLAGRELKFIETLLADASSPDIAQQIGPVITVASATVLNSNNLAGMNTVLAPLADASTAPWLRRALLDGVERFNPLREDPKDPAKRIAEIACLPAEPVALVALSKQSTEEGARAATDLQFLRWSGQPLDPEKALASLTPEQRGWYDKGRETYSLCAACHQPNGQGLAGGAPPLAGSRWVRGSPHPLLRILLNGKTEGDKQMPPLKSLDDETLSAVLTYIRRSWGNEAPPVSPRAVAAVREAVGTREQPWSETELENLH